MLSVVVLLSLFSAPQGAAPTEDPSSICWVKLKGEEGPLYVVVQDQDSLDGLAAKHVLIFELDDPLHPGRRESIRWDEVQNYGPERPRARARRIEAALKDAGYMKHNGELVRTEEWEFAQKAREMVRAAQSEPEPAPAVPAEGLVQRPALRQESEPSSGWRPWLPHAALAAAASLFIALITKTMLIGPRE